jgi:hypothetical protein
VIRAAVTRRLPGDSILTAVPSIMAFSSLNNADSAEPVAMAPRIHVGIGDV